ncbi:hypothetical protein WPS_12900 [Vulcanimicrobium alpinum]|uniref:Uncharacterized protein n=1 Tax=Vulcanimicrobium alpinum TaxID=3016050 RepID=A0AAN2C973_UNVUL|nr:hypothetical protein WPS_12900 [Vulcanimicrobium alpinum]
MWEKLELDRELDFDQAIQAAHPVAEDGLARFVVVGAAVGAAVGVFHAPTIGRRDATIVALHSHT